MALSQEYIDLVLAECIGQGGDAIGEVKRGDEIFEGTDYPRTWEGFIGQAKAKEQLLVTAASAKGRGARMEHTLLASGLHGIGKSTLATLLAYQAGVGLVRTTGPLTQDEARSLMQDMQPRDCLFIDEAHLLVSGSRTKADWLLPFMTEGVLYTTRGAERMPDVTIVAATTDVGKLPQTMISRFMIQPELVAYTNQEGALLTLNLADRMKVKGIAESAEAIGRAADNNPRAIRQILTQIRDLRYAYPDTHPNMEKALEWAGVSADGLTKVSREILLLLVGMTNRTASLDGIKATLGEPGPIHHHEQQLLRRGLIEVTPRGRMLTDAGVARARVEARCLSS